MEAVKLFFYLICLGVLISVFVNALKADEIDLKLTTKQIESLANSIAKEDGLHKIIRVIIRIESNDGRYPVNVVEQSCGLTHINLNTYLRRHNIKDSNFNRNKACSDLINNPHLAIANALEELLYWKTQHCTRNKCNKSQLDRVIKSYNAGWNYKSKKAGEYLTKFKQFYKQIYKTSF